MRRDAYNYVIIAGCSRFGANIAQTLCSSGANVVVIDIDKTSFRKLSPEYSGYKIVGDATDIDTLIEAGIKKAYTLVAGTNYDNVNIMISQIAKQIFNINNVVSRLYDTKKEVIYGDLDIKIIRPTRLSIEEFEKLAPKKKVYEFNIFKGFEGRKKMEAL